MTQEGIPADAPKCGYGPCLNHIRRTSQRYCSPACRDREKEYWRLRGETVGGFDAFTKKQRARASRVLAASEEKVQKARAADRADFMRRMDAVIFSESTPCVGGGWQTKAKPALDYYDNRRSRGSSGFRYAVRDSEGRLMDKGDQS